jgi:hypothetical protein
LEPKNDENEAKYWKRQNVADKDTGLYCQSCCFRYPESCIDIDTLHPYDRAAESCPDFIPKEYYKPKSKAKCWQKRLELDPEYEPLPDCELRHPVDWYSFVPRSVYYKIITKIKVYDYTNYKKKLEREGLS